MPATEKTLCNAGFLNFEGRYLGDGEVPWGGGSVILVPSSDSIVTPKVDLGGGCLDEIASLGDTLGGGRGPRQGRRPCWDRRSLMYGGAHH